MKKISLVFMFLTSPVMAQQAPTRESIIIQGLQAQRNQALDQVAAINAELQLITKELNDLKTKAVAKPDSKP